MAKLKVKKNTDNPETKEVLAEAVIKISNALESLRASGLNDQAIIILLRHKTGVSMSDIKLIFDGLRRMKGWYCR